MSVYKLNRRDFLKFGLTATGGLTLGLHFAPRMRAGEAGVPFAPNAFVRLASDNTVTIVVKHIEFGQGTFTGLPSVLADELDADWSQIRVVGAPADPSRYNNLNWGASQGTGGSSSMNNSFTQLRRAGASARAMLVAAAARAWQAPPGEITVDHGVIAHPPSGRRASFGDFATAAAAESLPKNVALKTPDRFTYIGRDQPRTDAAPKTDGSAVYTQDLQLPGMLTAVVAHPPRFGATPAAVDSTTAADMPGVRRIVVLPGGVAVVAQTFWQARQAREALKIRWDDSAAFKQDTVAILEDFHARARTPGLVARQDGDAAAALARAATVLEADFEFPYLAHAAMEPMNCIAAVTAERAEFWYGVQGQSTDLGNLSTALGIPREHITLNMLYAGGSFGRRAHGHSDYVVEAALIARDFNDGTPVKLVWTREDDMRAGAYRPLNVHRIRGGLDDTGRIIAWEQRIVGQSILAGIPGRGAREGVDRTCVEGASTLPYAIDNLSVEAHQPPLPVPVLWWRSVGHTHTAFSTETFFDELAHAAGRDPLELRLELLPEDPRRRAVLERAAQESGWGTPLPAGRGRGVAVHYSFKTWVAEVAEVAVHDDGSFAVERVTVAVDCGIAVNPDIVRAQMEGGVGYALSAVLGGAITFVDGVAQEDNFDTFPILRYAQMPRVEVHIMPSMEAPTGVGEPGVPPLAPAVANAIFAASGQRIRSLPFKLAAVS